MAGISNAPMLRFAAHATRPALAAGWGAEGAEPGALPLRERPRPRTNLTPSCVRP